MSDAVVALETPVATVTRGREGQEQAAQKGAEQKKVRLDFLDGLRGLAALYVVLHHIGMELTWKGRDQQLPALVRHLLTGFAPGEFAVVAFIVLSGYCLMLPVARSADGRLRGGFKEYIKRRAHRILPPYYAMLALSLLLIVSLPDLLQHETGEFTLLSIHSLTREALLSHLFLVHNFSAVQAYQINAPLWSVATEWQIYFLFPALLLPLWRRTGIVAVVIAGFAVGLAPHFLFHGHYDSAAPWLFGAFALGIVGVVINYSSRPWETFLRERVPWGALTLVIAGLALALLKRYGLVNPKMQALLQIVVSFAFASLLIYCTKHCHAHKETGKPAILRLLESRWVVRLGAMSYSLYLIHILVVEIVHALVMRLNPSPALELVLLMPLATGLSLLGAYLFHIGFERRFMPGQISGIGIRGSGFGKNQQESTGSAGSECGASPVGAFNESRSPNPDPRV